MWLELGAAALLNVERFALTKFIYLDMNPVDKARNAALALGMQVGAEWLLMIDADTFVASAPGATPGDQILRMIEDAAYEDAAVVIAPVRARDADRRIMAYRIEEHMTHKIDLPGTVDGAEVGIAEYRSIELGDERKLVPIDAGATAVMAINLQKVGDAYFKFIHGTREQAGLSEDLEFCRQIRAAGGAILCDTRVVTGHMARPEVIFTEISAFAQGKTIPEIKVEITKHPTQA